jgi:hypothetical protein
MTTNSTSDQLDPITHTQESLEVNTPTEQGSGGNIQDLEGRVADIVEQNKRLMSENRGLHSKVDRALNAIRADYEQAVVQNEMNKDLEDVPEDIRPYMERMYQRFGAQGAYAEPTYASPEDQMAKIHSFVQDFGVDPKDTRINYGVLYQSGLTDEQRQGQFVQSLRHIIEQGPVEQPQATAMPQQGFQQSPPVDNAPGVGSVGPNTVDDLRDSYITGQLNLDEYRRQMAAHGVRV